MATAGPTARPAHSSLHFRKRFPDADVSRLGKLPGRDPANPLVAREGRYIFPEGKHLWGRDDSFSKIRRQFVHRPARNSFFGHSLNFFLLVPLIPLKKWGGYPQKFSHHLTQFWAFLYRKLRS